MDLEQMPEFTSSYCLQKWVLEADNLKSEMRSDFFGSNIEHQCKCMTIQNHLTEEYTCNSKYCPSILYNRLLTLGGEGDSMWAFGDYWLGTGGGGGGGADSWWWLLSYYPWRSRPLSWMNKCRWRRSMQLIYQGHWGSIRASEREWERERERESPCLPTHKGNPSVHFPKGVSLA